MTKHRSDVVSASEIASWVWCPESWRLGALGKDPENRDELERGNAFHSRTTVLEWISRKLIALRWWLVALGLFGAVAALVFLKAVG